MRQKPFEKYQVIDIASECAGRTTPRKPLAGIDEFVARAVLQDTPVRLYKVEI